jgi:hypothetical protein
MAGFTRFAVAAALASTIGAGSALAEPGGCLKYGAVGAVGGHLAHHGVLGAAGGCAVGMYKRHEYRKQQAQMSREQQRQMTPEHTEQ